MLSSVSKSTSPSQKDKASIKSSETGLYSNANVSPFL